MRNLVLILILVLALCVLLSSCLTFDSPVSDFNPYTRALIETEFAGKKFVLNEREIIASNAIVKNSNAKAKQINISFPKDRNSAYLNVALDNNTYINETFTSVEATFISYDEAILKGEGNKNGTMNFRMKNSDNGIIISGTIGDIVLNTPISINK